MAFGYHGAILHVDLDTQTTRIEHPEDNFYRIYGGGGLLGTYFLLRDTQPNVDPLSPDNLLVFSNSVVAGFPGAGLVRYVVTTKSPLSNGIGETRSEGPWAVSLKKSGYDALVIHGSAKNPVSMVIEDGAVRFIDASHLWGKTVGQTTDLITTEFDRATDVATIGPAGERKVRYASIVSSRTHQAQRHGVGAVMGSKNLKAIILIGGKLPAVAHPEQMAAVNARFAEDMKKNTLSMWQKDLPGFAVWVHTHGLDAALNTENYRTATFEHLENYKAATWMPYFQATAKCPGCPNDCIKIYHNHEPDLDMRAGGMHQEVSGTMGPNIGTQHPRAVMRYNNLCNQYGLDPVSLGFTLSFAMESNEHGLIPKHLLNGATLRFGNTDATLAMIEQIVARKGLGDTLAEGSQRAAEIIGNGTERYAMHVKGVELVPFEPRSQSNLALGYATAPIGPRYDICEHDWDFDTQVGWDHSLDYARTLGIIERIPMEYLGPKKVRNYKALHTLWSAADALAFCIFAIAPTRVLSLQLMTDMLAAVTGWETSSHELLRFGERRTHLMQLYNRREGIVASSDTLPARFFSDPIDSGDKAGVFLDKTAFDAEIALYYEMMGWDESGTPRVGTLYEHHLEWAIPQLPAKPIVPAVVVTSSAPIDVALASEPVLETPALDTLELQTAEEPLTAPATSAETVSIAADAVDLTVHVDTAPPRTSDVSAEGTASEPATIDAISEEPDVTEPVASSVTASAITEPPVPAEATTVAELPTTDTAVHATVNEHTQQDEPTSELIPPVAPPHIPSAVAGAEEPTAEIAPPPVKKPAQTSTRGNRTPITSALLESLLTTPDPEPTAENLPADAAADVNISAAADDAPTGSLTPELLEQHLADAQAKTQESAKANVSLSQDIPTTDTAASGESAVPQPQTRLPAPAVKPYIPKPSSATALTNPQPLPEDFDFPKAPPPPKPDAAEATPPKPAPRTSIAKRLSIEELLKAELPPSVSSPPREDK